MAGPATPQVVFEATITFANASSRLSPDQETVLADLAGRLQSEGGGVFLEINGFTDSSGGERANEGLGIARAVSVYKFLAAQGVALNRMGVYSRGESDPIGDNATPEGRALNRRVVVRVVG